MNRCARAVASALALLATAGFARAGDAPEPDAGRLASRFYTDWELLYVERDRTPDVEVGFFDPTGFGGGDAREILSTDAVVDDDEEFGGRGVLGFRLDERSAVEIVYMGWGHERSATVRDAAGEGLFAFEVPDLDVGGTGLSDGSFDDAAIFDLEYDADFYSGELNYRRAMQVDGADYRFNLLAGIRAVRLEEDLDFTSLDEFPPLFAPNGSFGTYNIAARNTLIGLQLGVDTFVPLWRDLLELDLRVVAGGYANQSNVTIDYFNNDGLSASRESEIDWDAAGLFETAAFLKLRVYRGVRLAAGYRATYLVGIATAPDQFARSGSRADFFGKIGADDSTIFHGPSLKLSVDF